MLQEHKIVSSAQIGLVGSPPGVLGTHIPKEDSERNRQLFFKTKHKSEEKSAIVEYQVTVSPAGPSQALPGHRGKSQKNVSDFIY